MKDHCSHFVASIALVITAVGLVAITNRSQAAIPKKTLVYCSEGAPSGFDPMQSTTGLDFTANAFTDYNRLVELKRGGTMVEPSLAESWEISTDGKIYTFHLRHNVKFQTTTFFTPTREFDADDVVFTFRRLLDPDLPFRKAYPVKSALFTDMGLNKLIEKVEKIDPYTVKLTLSEPSGPFIQNMALGYASVLSAEYGDQLLKAGRAAAINQYPVGTGPFIFRSYTKDATIRFDGNADYWKPNAVKVSNLIFAITPDPAVRVQKLESGECQVIAYSSSMGLSRLSADKEISVLSQPGFQMLYVALNPSRKSARFAALRRALDVAIDRKAIVRAMYGQDGMPANAPIPPSQWPYLTNRGAAAYPPQSAKQSLIRLGNSSDLKITLVAEPVFPSARGEKTVAQEQSDHRMMAELIRKDWKKIGVEASVVQYGWAEYAEKIRSGKFDAAISGWRGDNGDPDNWFSSLLSCGKTAVDDVAASCNTQLEPWLERARAESDPQRRERDYLKVLKIFDREMPYLPISFSISRLPVSNRVSGLTIEPLGYLRFDNVELSG